MLITAYFLWFKINDIIIEINGEPVTGRAKTLDMIAETKPGTSMPVTIIRNGYRLYV